MCINNAVSFKAFNYDNFFQSLPNKDIKNSAKYTKLGRMLASPHWNRLALGGAAIVSQPWFDYYNPDVDRDTAKVSFCRTLAKIPVCTTVGFIVRGSVYKLTEKFMHGTPKEGSTLLTPESILKTTDKEVRNSKLKLHKNAFSTVAALGIMLFTNILLDAPLTTYFSNKLIAKVYKKENV